MTENERIIRGNDPSFRLAATEEKGRSSLAAKDQPEEEDARKNGQERITSARGRWLVGWFRRRRTERCYLCGNEERDKEGRDEEEAAGGGQRRKNGIRRLRVVIIINLSGI